MPSAAVPAAIMAASAAAANTARQRDPRLIAFLLANTLEPGLPGAVQPRPPVRSPRQVATPARCSQHEYRAFPGIPFDQASIGERINREAKAVTIQANRPDHFLVRPQIIILVVIGHDLSAALVLRKMTRRATHACSRRRIPGQFGAPRRVCELQE